MPNYQVTQKGIRTTARVPVVTNEHIADITNTGSVLSIDNEVSNITNGVVDVYSGEPDRTYITNRPSTEIQATPSSDAVTPAGTKGRGIHTWSYNRKTYIVNDDRVYEDLYNAANLVSGSLSITGTRRVYFAEWESANANYLFIIDPSQSKGYYIDSGDSPLALNAMLGSGTTTSGDPFNFTNFPSSNMVDGVVILNTYMHLGTQDGTIYNSAVGDPLNWTDSISTPAERANDTLVAIVLSKDHLIAMGTESIELFYGVAAATSLTAPIAPRTDIFYTNGIAAAFDGTIGGQAFWLDGDDIYLLSTKRSGDFTLSVLRNFELQPIGTSTINSFLRGSGTSSQAQFILSGFSTGGHTFVLCSIFDDDLTDEVYTLVYDAYSNAWYRWDKLNGTSPAFAIMDNTTTNNMATTTSPPLLIAPDGVVWRVNTLLVDGDNNDFSVIIGNLEFGTTSTKFMHELSYVGSLVDPSAAATMEISWSDDNGTNWSTPIEIDIAEDESLNRLGSFKRRKFKIANTSGQHLRMEALQVVYTEGT